jgi:hypothetical protein
MLRISFPLLHPHSNYATISQELRHDLSNLSLVKQNLLAMSFSLTYESTMRLLAAMLGVPLTTGQLVTKGVSTTSQCEA